MYFKGTIVITDPCYLDNGGNLDLWEKSDYGENLSVLGCSQWISKDTIYGDWSCTTCQGTDISCQPILNKLYKYYDQVYKLKVDDPMFEDLKDDLYNKIKELSESFKKQHPSLGKFCADTGMVCVVYLNEVLTVNPDFLNWAKTHPWCVTIIENFDGEITYEIDDNTDAHIVGKGNINFYTTQIEL